MISVDAKRNVEDIVSAIGITHIALASKLITWFADQPSEVQAGIVGPMFEGLTEVEPEIAFLQAVVGK